ncbi:hypothetical protein M446_6760 [Methylobacterium sp. 4-46]|uniref:hypothetical protein n=1 Tax=unclassified Methylobacterium TaxID=2615210 RepID=UPI000152EA92|nr:MULTISPECIES: hypothetical protein [Methylobacterium]ACA21005.1 hypothetical protein M446_6760 [Methylobacterium sp. 4-46]WFT80158.1 DUF456 domain-containing protein [Methylobacterium nodulans]
MRRWIIAGAAAAALLVPRPGLAQSSTAIGAGAGVVAGAVVAGPIGAVVGGLVGAAWGETAKPRRHLRRRAARVRTARPARAAPPARVARAAPAPWVDPR